MGAWSVECQNLVDRRDALFTFRAVDVGVPHRGVVVLRPLLRHRRVVPARMPRAMDAPGVAAGRHRLRRVFDDRFRARRDHPRPNLKDPDASSAHAADGALRQRATAHSEGETGRALRSRCGMSEMGRRRSRARGRTEPSTNSMTVNAVTLSSTRRLFSGRPWSAVHRRPAMAQSSGRSCSEMSNARAESSSSP